MLPRVCPGVWSTFDGRPPLGRVACRGQGHFEAGLEAREGAAQIMGDVVGDRADAAHQPLDLLQHLVEVLREPVELVVGGADRHAVLDLAGDEFVVVLPNTPGDAARRVARDLIRSVPPPVGLSVGIGCMAEGIQTTAELFAIADNALRSAKQSGVSMCVV